MGPVVVVGLCVCVNMMRPMGSIACTCTYTLGRHAPGVAMAEKGQGVVHGGEGLDLLRDGVVWVGGLWDHT